jgi:hypothetical protein
MVNNIFLSIVTGVATTASTAVLLSLINFVRNFWLERKIKSIITQTEPTGILTSKNNKTVYDFAGLIISNKLDIPITVRSVLAETEEKSGRVLWYSGPTFGKDIYPVRQSDYDNPFGFVTLPPFTNGRWGMESNSYYQNHRVPQKLFHSLKVSVQYLSFLKNPKIMEIIVTKESVFRAINGLVEEANNALRLQNASAK